MLNEICGELNNWFDRERINGKYTVAGGSIDLSDLARDGRIQSGQYFRIRGSVFNDGIYQYPASDLDDEVFEGSIWTLAIPKEIIDLSFEVGDWMEKYGDDVNSPYSSESLFGDYSYTKATSGSTADGGAVKWQSVFARKLNRWRKLR